MSFKYVITKFFKNSYNILFIKACMLVNTLVSPNNITVYSKYPKLVRNTVFFFFFNSDFVIYFTDV